MRSKVCATEVHHAIEARVGCASTLIPMVIELFLRQDVSACLDQRHQQDGSAHSACTIQLTSQEKETMTKDEMRDSKVL